MGIDLSQFIPSFLEESFEGLSVMEKGLLNLEASDSETINTIFRAAHSIKGGAGTFGFNHVTDFTHLVETLLDEMRNDQRAISHDDVEVLLRSVDGIRMLLDAIRDDSEYDNEKILSISAALEETLSLPLSDTSTTDDVNALSGGDVHWQIDFIPEHHLVQTGNDPLLLFNALSELGELTVNTHTNQLPPLADLDAEELYLSWQLTLVTSQSEQDIREVFEWVEDECQLVIQPLTRETEPTFHNDNINETLTPPVGEVTEEIPSPEIQVVESKVKSIAKSDLSSIRVSVDKVDSLINLVGELVITQSMLSEIGNSYSPNNINKLKAGLDQLLHNTKELQESVMRIRMLPISFAFNRFPRLVHDLSVQTGKEIELVIHGEHTELDKSVMEQIGDPLTHLVRNAIDHGIESSEIRLENGKPAIGTISLNAYHQGGNIVIEINDDGGGINRDAVLKKAIEKNIIDTNATLTEAQVFDLIFEPGFSTAAQISDISGRGVGMDVVKKNVQALGGSIQIESTVGKGSTFKVYLPLTLAILDGQLVKVGMETYIIPLIVIVESLQPNKALMHRVSGDMWVYKLRDENVPILPIHQLFNLATEVTEATDGLLVVVEAEGQKVGLMVDELLSQQQVVIKSLKDNYQEVEGISGATILGNGEVALIIDVPGIINIASCTAYKKQSKSKLHALFHLREKV